MTHRKETAFGFEFGAARVERLYSHKGAVCLRVGGTKKGIEIYVSRTGRSVKVIPCEMPIGEIGAGEGT